MKGTFQRRLAARTPFVKGFRISFHSFCVFFLYFFFLALSPPFSHIFSPLWFGLGGDFFHGNQAGLWQG